MSGGQWIQQVTLGWLLYDLTGSAVLLGLLNGLRALPFLIASPIAGVAADRMDRKKLILVTQYVLVTATIGMGVLVGLGFLQVWHLFVFTVITGITWAFVDPVRQTLVPALVPREDLMNAVALNSAAFNLTKIIGPSLGGALIVVSGAAGNFFVQSLAYLGVLASIYWMTIPPTPTEARQSSAMANLKEGLVYVWSNPLVFALMATALVPRIFAVPYQTLMPVFQKDVLKVGPEGLGMLLAAPGLGAMLAGLMLATMANRVRRQEVLMLVSLVSLGVVMNLFSQTTSFPLAILALVAVGSCQVFYMATTNTMLQGDCSRSFAWARDEHLCSRSRANARRRANRGNKRPRHGRPSNRQLHGFGGGSPGNSCRVARPRGSRHRAWDEDLTFMLRPFYGPSCLANDRHAKVPF